MCIFPYRFYGGVQGYNPYSFYFVHFAKFYNNLNSLLVENSRWEVLKIPKSSMTTPAITYRRCRRRPGRVWIVTSWLGTGKALTFFLQCMITFLVDIFYSVCLLKLYFLRRRRLPERARGGSGVPAIRGGGGPAEVRPGL